jgi:hypothetical protein
MAQARRLSNKATRQHFLVTTTEEPQDNDKPGDLERRRLMAELWINNLRRFGIETILLSGYAELGSLLVEVAQKSRGSTVYVVGSHLDKANNEAQELGRSLATRDIVLIDGQSEGVSRQVITAFVEEGVKQKRDVYKHLKTFANPYSVNAAFASDPNQIPILKSWRAPLLRSTQVFVCFDGGMGTKAELEVALQSGCRIVPVPGGSAGMVATSVLTNRAILDGLPAQYAGKLKGGTVTAADIVECIDKLIQ